MVAGRTDSTSAAAPADSGRDDGISRKFVKYCLVGASGVGVNLGTLYLLAAMLGVHANIASALAIEVSILSNFLWNDTWTFREQRRKRSLFARLVRFHLVTLLGAGIQWLIFVIGNALVFAFIVEPGSLHSATLNLSTIVLHPPDVGGWRYLSQLTGIAIATCWNFVANALWTWRLRSA